jgi:sortase A
MLRSRKGRWGLILVGIGLLVWGATSGFSEWKVLNSLQPDALDNPNASQGQWIYPTLNPPTGSQSAAPSQATDTPFQPGGPVVESTLTGEGEAFSVPYTPNPGSPAAQSSVTPAPTPVKPVGLVPERIVIPAIHLDAPIVTVPYRLVKDETTGMVYQQWSVPNEYAVGWQTTSALLGVTGNTVLDGHHNEYGMVFRYLIDLQPGATIELFSGETEFRYTITNKMILPERNEPLSVRFNNARWLLPSTDQRITLVTCWPFTSNTHRLIIVAVPTGRTDLSKTTHRNGGGSLP